MIYLPYKKENFFRDYLTVPIHDIRSLSGQVNDIIKDEKIIKK